MCVCVYVLCFVLFCWFVCLFVMLARESGGREGRLMSRLRVFLHAFCGVPIDYAAPL